MEGRCKLCNQKSELKVSHFIPKFIGKWIKKTSITGFMRFSGNEEKRAQDIPKEYWLCGECERLFSTWETNFASKIFYPFVNDGKCVASYEAWMSKFCASLSWRTLTYIRSKNSQEGKPVDYYQSLDDAENHLANYLLGKVNNLDQYEQHVFPLVELNLPTGKAPPTNINRYLLRSVAMDIIDNTKDLLIFTKLPSFIILGVIKLGECNKMRASRIALKYGKVRLQQYWLPTGFIDYIADKANQIAESHRKIPQKHLQKIDKYLIDNPEKAVNSKSFEAFLSDYEIFRDDVFKE